MRVAVSAVLALGAVLLVAQPAMAATAWRVDPAASKLGFRGSMGGEAFSGQFRRWSAQIVFDPKDLAHSSATATVDATSAQTGDADRDQALPGPDWFAAKTFPSAVFTARSFKDLGGGHYQAIGDLSLRGIKRPVVLPFTLAISGDTAKATGSVQLNRLDFGVGQGRWKTGEVVAPQVTVTPDLTAHRGR
jgi:polyisoprenoid-binding protein YceI